VFRLTRHGFKEMLIGSLVLAIVGAGLGLAWWPLALIVLPVLVWLFAFFRDPERTLPLEQHVMVSPSDGKITDITRIDHDPLLGGPCVRVGVFLSVFDVHINRSPCDGTVLSTHYKPGKFINALKSEQVALENESNTIVIGDKETGRPVALVKQISGAIARRIICTANKGDAVTIGQRIGMIKFGSRTELYIPDWLEPQLKVQVGERLRGAADVIAVLGQPVHAHATRPTTEEVEPLAGRATPA
jgi:phosphatidylserine decarboxylase